MDYFVLQKMDRWALGAQKSTQNRQKCRKNVFVRDNLENGWMDFDNFFLFAHYEYRLTHGLLRFAKSEQMGAQHPKNLYFLT